VFQKLVASKVHDQDGLELLATLVESVQLPAYQQHLPTVWSILFTRLQTSRTPKYVRCLVVAISRCVLQRLRACCWVLAGAAPASSSCI
jgi:exportin-2 (importin alpha re-exporter)